MRFVRSHIEIPDRLIIDERGRVRVQRSRISEHRDDGAREIIVRWFRTRGNLGHCHRRLRGGYRQCGDRDWLVALDRNPLYIVRVELWPDGDPGRSKVVAAGEPMTWVTISPDERWVVSTTFPPKDARLWDAATGQEKLTLTGHQDAVLSVRFSPNGQTIASGSDDKTIRLWDVATGQGNA